MLTETVLIEQNRQLREENEELRETIRQMREAGAELEPLPDWLPPLTRIETTVLLMLRDGRLVTTGRIMGELYEERDDPPGENIVRVWISHLRRKLAPHVDIRNVWGRGYQITPASRELLRVERARAA